MTKLTAKGRANNIALPSGPWLRTQEACTALGISRHTLGARVKAGYLVQGKHWMASGPAAKATRFWNIESCMIAMAHWSAPERVD